MHLHGIGTISRGKYQDRMSAESAGQFHDLFSSIAGSMVNEVFCTAFHDDVFLISLVDTDDTETHALRRNLNSQMTKATACTKQRDPLSALSITLSECAVNSDTCAKPTEASVCIPGTMDQIKPTLAQLHLTRGHQGLESRKSPD